MGLEYVEETETGHWIPGKRGTRNWNTIQKGTGDWNARSKNKLVKGKL